MMADKGPDPVTLDLIENALLASLPPSTSPSEERLSDDTAILHAAFHVPWRPPSRHEVGDAIVIAVGREARRVFKVSADAHAFHRVAIRVEGGQ